jgi:hypothetical protein
MSHSVAISKDPIVSIWRAKQFTDTFHNGPSVSPFRIFFVENDEIRGKSGSCSRCRSQDSNSGNFEKTRILDTRK